MSENRRSQGVIFWLTLYIYNYIAVVSKVSSGSSNNIPVTLANHSHPKKLLYIIKQV